MLGKQDFEEVLKSIDRSKSIPTRLKNQNIDSEELRDWLLTEFNNDFPKVATFGAGLEFGMQLARKLDEVHS
jgi:hypothetical protein